MASEYVITVLALDRVGIVAGVTRAVTDLGGNVDAVSQTVLQNYFTLILTARFSRDLGAAEVREAVEKTGTPGELAVSIKERVPGASRVRLEDEEQFVLSIVGPNRPGVVSRIAAYLASRSINVVDLYSYTVGEEIVLIGQVMIPKRLDVRQLQLDLEGLPMGKDLQIRLQHEDIFVATNEIEFRHKGIGPK